MKVAVLFSGGKDSNYALYKAKNHGHSIGCLISMISENPESYMFQSAGNSHLKMQAECLDIPLRTFSTKGIKEKELADLEKALISIKKEFGIEGLVTGAIRSAYQSARIQKICSNIGLWCFNPLWQIDDRKYLNELIESGFRIMIVGIFSYPLNSQFLGKIIDRKTADKLFSYQDKYSISFAGEGGEIETFVIDGPTFIKKLEITGTDIKMDSENSGIIKFRKCSIIKK